MVKLVVSPATQRNKPRVRRAYYDCRYGQLHVHQALPAGGGFDEATALLCIPGQSGSGRYFRELLAPMGGDRSVYAVDLPGKGESDPVGADIGVADAAAALGDLLDTLRLRSADLLAHRQGAAVALALQQQRPAAIRRMVLSEATDLHCAHARSLPIPALILELGSDDMPLLSPEQAGLAKPALLAFLGGRRGV